MTNALTAELRFLLDLFVSGQNTSLEAANLLEVLLDEAFPNDDVVQDRVGDLAQYRPGGGEFLFDETEMRSRLACLQGYLAAQGQ